MAEREEQEGEDAGKVEGHDVVQSIKGMEEMRTRGKAKEDNTVDVGLSHETSVDSDDQRDEQ